jgi:hypothetical protein
VSPQQEVGTMLRPTLQLLANCRMRQDTSNAVRLFQPTNSGCRVLLN